MKLPRNSHVRGFTLIEVMVVLGILALVAAFSIVLGFDSIGRATAIGERDTVVTLLQAARARALANIDGAAHGLHISTSTFTLFTGDAYDPGDADNKPYDRSAAVTVTGPGDIVFDQLSGAVGTGEGTLTFVDGAGTATIEINEEGRIEW